ncbi:fimbria/pilus outer membrane usher protein [Xenorhabdus griffiniae]|uniref:Fimbria/pilus outer membrane usher protein n=1 Tax=Xenorhabdus griffiniae TaxID=351672 RepID=A0ABY9XD94_9GAMM|nr:fimbria/pilus outer membrane usher protein [Xenorhabdus griffiniae]MBD1228065.1 fimbrial biogenesis outer membrane usher protein [Xenorhabdus griffiniae]MBE8587485.1 fimbrial biogenesis outer membrane usher protein [Xenorhabdus griffiniae]WMV70879.1 fimbria/pilus outer membrane usher protein [Xenorhabdus griffiniae]WNH00555.1 fimbria/pilus outer membrane usher protein [Xenorhabdus griffiniae]
MPTYLLSIFILCFSVLLSLPVTAQDYFRLSALELDETQSAIDLSVFSFPGGQLPGQYQVSIFLNGKEKETKQVNFIKLENGKLSPQLTVDNLKQFGVKMSAFPALMKLSPEQVIDDISEYILQASTSFDFYGQRLDISIPQAALDNQAKDTVAPHLWQHGETAFLMSYNFSGSENDNKNTKNQSYFLNLQSGINIGAWRIRNQSVYEYNSEKNQGESRFSSINSYIQRDIPELKSQIILGETFTDGDIFESVPFIGASMTSDSLMLPSSQRGFAPIIRGIAQTHARVTIRQNNYVIYESYVPPGPFVITDLYSTSGSGDLDITITEKDGQQRKFVQPFSSVPVMQREGQLKYQVTLGRYRYANANTDKPYFSEATFIYGLSNRLSLLSGVQVAENYRAFNAGLGIGLGNFGAISLDMTQADAWLHENKRKQGQSYRIQYTKSIEATGTSLTLAGYRYSTPEYYSFAEANEYSVRKEAGRGQNKRSQLQLTLNQGMGDFGNIYVSAYQQDYWGKQGTNQSLSAGYNINLAGISYGLNLSYDANHKSIKSKDIQTSFTVSIPLDQWLPNGWVTYSMNRNGHSRGSQQLTISGSALDDHTLSYSIHGERSNNMEGTSGGVSLEYSHSSGRVNLGYSYSDNSQSLNYGLSGGIVAHQNGITFSQSLGETVALVKAAGAAETKILNHSGIKTDSRGYAVIPSIEPYTYNRIALDTEMLADGVDLDNSVQHIVPTRGAVVAANFRVRQGHRILVTLRYNGKPVPFGASAALTNGDSSGIVGDDGELYLNAVPEQAEIKVQWGKNKHQQCRAKTDVSVLPEKSGVLRLTADCRT